MGPLPSPVPQPRRRRARSAAPPPISWRIPLGVVLSLLPWRCLRSSWQQLRSDRSVAVVIAVQPTFLVLAKSFWLSERRQHKTLRSQLGSVHLPSCLETDTEVADAP